MEKQPETVREWHCWFCGSVVKSERQPDCKSCGVWMHSTDKCEPGHSKPESLEVEK